MKARLQDSPARDTYLNLVRAHEKLTAEFAVLFGQHGLTQAQFNVLRILVQGPDEGVSCQRIKDGLLTRVPDVTRLLDRMESSGLLERERSADDRRVVLVRITRDGRRRCEDLYGPVDALHRRQFEHMKDTVVASLNRGLRRLLEES